MICEFDPCCLNALGLDLLMMQLLTVIIVEYLANELSFPLFLASGFYVGQNPCSNLLKSIQYPSSDA